MVEQDLLPVRAILDEYATQKFNLASRFEGFGDDDFVEEVQDVQSFYQLKDKLRSTRLIQQFLTHIEKSNSTEPPYNELFPTQSEYADVELEMAKMENELSSILKRRTEQQNRVKRYAEESASEFLRLQAESEQLEALLLKKRVADQLARVRAARGNDDAIETLATDASLTTAAARALNDMLASDKYEMRNAITTTGPRCSQLRAQLEHAQQRHTELGAERDALLVQESTLEDADPCTKELKQIAERNRGRELVAIKATGCTLEFLENSAHISTSCGGEELHLPKLSSVDLGIRILELMK